MFVWDGEGLPVNAVGAEMHCGVRVTHGEVELRHNHLLGTISGELAAASDPRRKHTNVRMFVSGFQINIQQLIFRE